MTLTATGTVCKYRHHWIHHDIVRVSLNRPSDIWWAQVHARFFIKSKLPLGMWGLSFCSNSLLCLLHPFYCTSSHYANSLSFSFVEKKKWTWLDEPRKQLKDVSLKGWRQFAFSRFWKVPFSVFPVFFLIAQSSFFSSLSLVYSESEKKQVFKELRSKHVSVQLNPSIKLSKRM